MSNSTYATHNVQYTNVRYAQVHLQSALSDQERVGSEYCRWVAYCVSCAYV